MSDSLRLIVEKEGGRYDGDVAFDEQLFPGQTVEICSSITLHRLMDVELRVDGVLVVRLSTEESR